MIYFFHGAENFLVYREYQKFITAQKKQKNNLLIEVFDFFDEYNFDLIKKSFRSGGGLFSSDKVIVIKNPTTLKIDNKKDFLKRFKLLIKEGEKGTTFVFVDLMGKKKDSVITNLRKLPIEEKFFDVPTPRQLYQIIDELIADYSSDQVTIPSSIKAKLVKLFGVNLWKLSTELLKLAGYKESGEINEADLAVLSDGKIAVKIFDLMDAVGANNKKSALDQKEELLADGANEFYLFTMIVSQLRNMLIVKDSVDKKISQEKVLATTLMHPFVFKKTLSQVYSLDKKRLERAFIFAGKLDGAMKIGKIDPRDALDELIIRA